MTRKLKGCVGFPMVLLFAVGIVAIRVIDFTGFFVTEPLLNLSHGKIQKLELICVQSTLKLKQKAYLKTETSEKY